MMRASFVAIEPIESEAPAISPRVALVTSLLRDAELVTGRARRDPNEVPAPDGDRHSADGAGAAWCLKSGDGPQTRRLDPARAVARWYLRGKTGLEELLLQLYFGHLSMAEVESVATILWGNIDGAGMIREVVPGIVERIDGWLTGPIQHYCPYIFLHAVEYRCRRVTEAAGMQIAAAVGINELGYRETLGVVATPLAQGKVWDSLLASLVARGVRPPRLVVGGTTDGAMRAAVESRWKNCGFLMPLSELERGLLENVNPADVHWVDEGLSELRACASRSGGERVGLKLRDRLKKAGYSALSVELSERLDRHLACFDVPRAHQPRLRCANLVRTELSRVREQARVLGPINDEKTMVLLAAAIFRRQCRISWNAKPFLYV